MRIICTANSKAESIFISIGTWGLVGKEMETPITTIEAFQEGFTNEGTSEGHYRQCGTMSEILEDWLGPLEERLENEYNFTVIDHRLDFQGICSKCRSKNEQQ